MAIVEKRVCDVYGTVKDIKRYRVAVFEDTADAGGAEDSEWVEVHSAEADLSPRGFERAKKFAVRAVTKPSRERNGNDDA